LAQALLVCLFFQNSDLSFPLAIMGFGQVAVTSPTSKNIWAARSSPERRNNAARSVGVAVAASCKLKLGLSNANRSCQVSPFESWLAEANHEMSDESMSATRCSSAASSSNMSLPGSLDEEKQRHIPIVKTTTRARGSSVKRHPRSADHFSRIAFELCQKASFKSSQLCEAFRNADKNNEGMITQTGMEDVFWFFDLPSSDATIFFQLMDKNNEGQIWWREIVAVLAPVFKKGDVLP